MTNYNDYDYDVIASTNINEEHMPVLILADISGSMAGNPIASLNSSVNRFVDQVRNDPVASGRVDVAVVGFNHDVHVVQNWRPVTEVADVDFQANGGTNLSLALETGVEMLRVRGRLYAEMGISIKVPYLILITDGYGGDVTEIAKVIKERTAQHKFKLWVLAVNGYDKKTVATLTDGVRVLEQVDEEDFSFFDEYFNFMAMSVKAVSTSAPGQDIVKVESNIGREGSACRVPDLDKWLNN